MCCSCTFRFECVAHPSQCTSQHPCRHRSSQCSFCHPMLWPHCPCVWTRVWWSTVDTARPRCWLSATVQPYCPHTPLWALARRPSTSMYPRVHAADHPYMLARLRYLNDTLVHEGRAFVGSALTPLSSLHASIDPATLEDITVLLVPIPNRQHGLSARPQCCQPT